MVANFYSQYYTPIELYWYGFYVVDGFLLVYFYMATNAFFDSQLCIVSDTNFYSRIFGSR